MFALDTGKGISSLLRETSECCFDEKKFFIPGVKCCGSICFEGFHFHDYQQNPSVWPSRYTLRSMQLQGCVYLPGILTKWNLGFLKAMWKIKPHMWTAPNKSREVASLGGASKLINHKNRARKKPAVKSHFFSVFSNKYFTIYTQFKLFPFFIRSID